MLIAILITEALFLRLTPHMPNFTPITAVAIFGGTYANKKFAFIIPLVSIIVSDYLLLYINPFRSPLFDFSHIYPVSAMFHATTLYVWGSFMISGLIGIWIKNHKTPSNIFFGIFLASFQFFLITNFGVWAGGMYSRGLDGLMESYMMGLPFFKYTLLGDLFYTTVFLGAYEFTLSFSKKLRVALN